jgi:hypothetical protein
MLGGCQDKINGHWTIKNSYVILRTAVNRDSVSYFMPDLNSNSWTITKNGIKPEKPIDNGCFKESALHQKQ